MMPPVLLAGRAEMDQHWEGMIDWYRHFIDNEAEGFRQFVRDLGELETTGCGHFLDDPTAVKLLAKLSLLTIMEASLRSAQKCEDET